jgi:coniferyl-aldehyde dehydrogenase
MTGSNNGVANGTDQNHAVSVKYTKLFIDGEFVDAVSGKTFETLDPRTGDLITRVAEADKADVDLAVKAARKAFDHGPWPRMSGYERGRFLNKYADLVEQHIDELAALETLDNGKPLTLARAVDVMGSVKTLRYFAGAADKIHGETLKMGGQYHGYTLHEPIGVVGQIIPWNFPLVMFFNKISPALACGCTVVMKPAEQTPLTALYCAHLAKEAGLPPGVLNVLPGFGEKAGAAISSHMDIDKIAFTGSTDIGRLIMVAAAQSNLKPVTLELGGKSPFIIMDDADIEEAVNLAHMAVFYNMGQVCCSGSRIYVQEGIHDKFVKRVVERAKKQVVGDPFKPEVDHGPQIDKRQFEKVLEYIEHGKREGAKLMTGGNRVGEKGFYIEPTIFSHVQEDMKIGHEEIFGPVMSIFKFRTIEEAIELGNKTIYGLAAGILTKNIDVANRLSRSIRAGVIWINCYFAFDCDAPFGGYKMSGIGREQGLEVLKNYLAVKCVITPLHDSPWL